MDNGIYVDFCMLLLGPQGKYWFDTGPVEHIICKIIYKDYFDKHKTTSREVVLRYLAGNSQLSPRIKRHYCGDHMREQLRRNMITLIAKSHCDSKVYRICSNVHNWLENNHLPIHDATEMTYHDSHSTLYNAAIYLGDVMYYVMLSA